MAPASVTTNGGSGGVPEEVNTLFNKHMRMKGFIHQITEEIELLDKVKDACSDLVAHKERAKYISLCGPSQPSQIQIKKDLNEWVTAQNDAMMKQDILEVYIKDYRRQIAWYEQEIVKRGYSVSKSGGLVAGAVPLTSMNSMSSLKSSTTVSNAEVLTS